MLQPGPRTPNVWHWIARSGAGLQEVPDNVVVIQISLRLLEFLLLVLLLPQSTKAMLNLERALKGTAALPSHMY